MKNLDLWQRVDRAMQYHQVDCRMYRIDPPHQGDSGESTGISHDEGSLASFSVAHKRVEYRIGRFVIRFGRKVLAMVAGGTRRLAVLRTAINPRVWFG